MNNKKHTSARNRFTNILLHFAFFLLPCLSFAQTLAPGAPGKDAHWATAGKQAIGTSASLESKVWFTLAQGALTEVYYPDVTVANVHLLQFVVVSKKTGKIETEKDDTTQEIEYLDKRSLPFSTEPPTSLSFYQTNWSKSKKWRIRKKYITDPQNNTVLIDIEFTQNLESKDSYDIYVYYDPSLNNTGMHDTAWTQNNMLLASDGDKFSALTSLYGFTATTNGFFGASDGLTQLRNKKKLEVYDKAENGNVVQFAKLKLEGGDTEAFRVYYRTTLALSFGKNSDEVIKTAKASFQKGFRVAFSEYEKGWSDYVKNLPKVEAKYQAQFNMAAMVLKAQEDKSVRGANVASLTIPWGGGKNANEDVGGGYHLVWSRDLYQVFTAYLALGDTAAANRALDFLFNIQQKADGSFPQNSWLDGRNGWGGLQMDEVGFPLIMAYQLKRFDKKTYENHVKKAADFIVKNGPKTPQERWEEKGGYSPSTIAAEIAGLVCAAEIARKNGDETSANLWLKTADDWQANIEKWTVTTNGKFGDGNYYVRLTANGKPDAGEKIELSNSSGAFFENEIVDAGFLELVRLGIKSPDDPLIVKSLKVIDSQIKVNTPNGESFYRYNHDGYGEQPDGRRWNFDGTYSGTGRLWALLAGERAQYELAFWSDIESKYKIQIDGITNWDIANSRLGSMAKFANEGLMIPEQIWDKRDTPKNIDKQFVPELKFGEGTGSATPLAWSMAQFIRLAVNLQAGKNLDTPDVVYNRYVLGKKSEVSTQNSLKEANKRIEIATNCYGKWWDENRGKVLQQSPIILKCEDGISTPVFVYSGKGENIEVVGDFTEWKPKKLILTRYQPYAPVEGDFLEFSRFYPLGYIAPTARVEYKLIVDGKWITDPLNPNKVNNGVGGENSFFTMPDYKPTTWDAEKNKTANLETVEIDSKIYGKRIVQVYQPMSEPSAVADGLSSQKRNIKNNAPIAKVQPPATADGSVLPVLYLQDGSDYINRAKAIQIQQNLVKANKIKPFIMVFLDPKDRMKEYWANDNYAKFLAIEVVPAIDAKYKTIKSRDGRAIMGASLGGITSVHAGVKYPEIFARIGGQSSSWWIDNERVVKELETLDAKRNSFKFYFDTGTLEGADDDQKAVEMLRRKGFDVTYREAETGHNWTSWRDRLADAFIALWK